MSFTAIAALTLHDVKNRLAELAGRAEAAGDSETLRVAMESAQTLTRLLTYYRSDAGSLNLEIDAYCPADLVAELGRDEELSGSKLELVCQHAPTLWFFDQNLVRMVLANAVQNARRYACRSIALEASERDGFLEFCVRDDGPGFPEHILADASGAAAPVTRGGTGLGLRLARRIAAMHVNAGKCGEIRLENCGGAVFRLLLPK